MPSTSFDTADAWRSGLAAVATMTIALAKNVAVTSAVTTLPANRTA
jgi:hypothetical protein